MNPTLAGVLIGSGGVLLGSVISVVGALVVARIQRRTALVTTNNQLEAAYRHHREQLAASAEATKQEIHSRVVLAERMKWISELRNCIAEFQGRLGDMHGIFASDLHEPLTEEERAMTRPLLTLIARTRLLLNPKESDHQRLIVYLRQAFDEVTEGRSGKAHDLFISAAQDVLKREWERVKKGE